MLFSWLEGNPSFTIVSFISCDRGSDIIFYASLTTLGVNCRKKLKFLCQVYQ